jgi:hypothetical protein
MHERRDPRSLAGLIVSSLVDSASVHDGGLGHHHGGDDFDGRRLVGVIVTRVLVVVRRVLGVDL